MNEKFMPFLKVLYKNRQKLFYTICFTFIFGIIMMVTREDEFIIIAGYFLISFFGAFLLRYLVNDIISKIKK